MNNLLHLNPIIKTKKKEKKEKKKKKKNQKMKMILKDGL